jgi:hypothetical protein
MIVEKMSFYGLSKLRPFTVAPYCSPSTVAVMSAIEPERQNNIAGQYDVAFLSRLRNDYFHQSQGYASRGTQARSKGPDSRSGAFSRLAGSKGLLKGQENPARGVYFYREMPTLYSI